MLRKIPAAYSLFLLMATAILFLSNNNNPPNGFTGAPPSGQTCASCHGGGSASGNIVISGLPSVITPDQIYPITVTVTRTTATPQKAGFQMTVLDGSNAFAGVFSSPGSGATVQNTGGIFYFEHSTGQSFGAGNTVTFTVNWRAPVTGSGVITMYAAANLANGNNSTSGDFITTTTASGTLDDSGGPIATNITSTNASCFGGSDGTATANPTGGGGPPYFYMWSTGSMQQSISNLSPGTYLLTVTNGSGGMGTGMVTITAPPPLNVSITGSGNITCTNLTGFATAQASGGTPNYTYSWSNGSTGSTGLFSSPGLYSVTATDSHFCTAVTTVNITANTTAPTAVAGPDRTISCTNPTTTLNGAGSSTGGNITYQWTGPGIVSGGNTLTPLVSLAGTYNLLVTNQSNGCTASDQAVVTGNTTPPTANAGPDQLITCANGMTTTLNGEGSSSGANISYAWSGPGIVSGGATATPTVNAAGTYTLTVTNQTNNCTASDQVAVTANTTPPVANAGMDKTITCANPNVQLNGSGSSAGAGITYVWSGPGIVNGGNTLTPTVNATGAYTLTVNNGTNGCSASDQVEVTSNSTPPIANAGPGQTLTCSVTSLTLNGTGSSSGTNIVYAWSGPGIVSGGASATPVVNVAGTYILTVSDQTTGCSASSQVIVLSDTTAPVANAGADLIITCGNTQGTLDGTASSSGTNIVYAWSGPGIVSGDTTLMPTVNLAGAYTLVVSNQSNGCTSTDQVSVSVNTALNMAVQSAPATCFGASTGTATALASGGNGNYAYLWSNGATTAQITGLTAGTYSVTATNGNCTATGSTTVAQPPALVVNVVTSAETSPGAADGTATAMVTGGSSGYSFLWNTGATTASISALAPGDYSVTVMDNNGCTTSATAEVNNSICTGFELSLTAMDMVCEDDMSGSISASLTGGAAPFSFEWSNNETGAMISGLGVGVYSVSVTDGNDCFLLASAAVAVLPDTTKPVVMAQPLTVYLNTIGEAEITPEMADDGSDDNCGIVTLQLSRDRFSCADIGTQTIALTAIDAAGNEATAAFPVTVLDTIPPNILCPPGLNAIGCDLVIDYGSPSLLIEWCDGQNVEIPVALISGPPSGSIFPMGESIITLEATDPSGNSSSCSFSVIISSPPAPTAELVTPLCTGSADGSITVMPLGDLSGYAFQWNDPAGQTTATAVGLSAGDYEVIISGNSNNCVDTFSYSLEDPSLIEIALDELVPELSVDMNGAISVTVSGGQGEPYDYIWSFNGQPFSTEEDLSGLSMGEYTLRAIDINGCEASDTFTLDRLTKTFEPAHDYALLLYPNPSKDLLNLQVTGEKAAGIEVALIDFDGRMLRQLAPVVAARHTFHLDVADYAPGIYLVRVIIDGGVLWRKIAVER